MDPRIGVRLGGGDAAPDADAVYARYLETCRRLNVEPVPREHATELLREWGDAIVTGRPVQPINHSLSITRTCPRCGSLEVRRASFRTREEKRLHVLRSPYRCKECGLRFWVISRKVRHLMIWAPVLLAPIIVAATIAFLMPARLPEPQPSAAPSSGASLLPDP